MFNFIAATPKKTPTKKAPAKKAPVKKAPVEKVEEVKTPPLMAQPGTYMREAGVIMLSDSFKQETVMPLVQAIMEYNAMEEELAPERITLMINSPGGRIDSCLTLIDTMFSSLIPVDTFATGLAASCGILTLMSGEHRMASSSAQIMSHQYAAGAGGKEHELYGRMKSFEQTSEWMVNHYEQCTGLSRALIRDKLLGPTDVWLHATEAFDFNIIDEVVDPYEMRELVRRERVQMQTKTGK
jgi:ATP-dependent Clp protease protease subunit